MNSFTLTAVGNLARNPELAARNDTSYTRFCLVGNDYAGKDEEGAARAVTTSLWFTAFGALGEALARNARKGDQLIIEAHVRASNWTDKQGEKKYDHSFIVDRQEYINVRERWATLTNEALREANVAARIDHRSLAAQGIEREPLPAIPLMNLRMERRGVPSEFAERLRAEYRERVQRRLERSGTPAVTAPGPAESSRAEVAAAAASAAAAGQSQSLASPLSAARVTDLEEIRRQAREAWLQLRSKEAARTDGQSHEPQERAEHAATGEREALPSEGPSRDDLAL
jgi:single-strand DNA-binding protein